MPWVDEIDAAPAVSPTGGKWLDDDDPVTEPTPATAGTVEGIGNSFRRGVLAGQRAIEATQFQPEAPTMRQGRRAFTGAMEDPRYTFGLLGENPDKMEQLLGPAARLNAMTGSARESNIATAGNIADLTTRMEGIPQSAAMQEWAQADNSNWWKVLGNNFLEIAANIFAESVPQASLGMAAGIAGSATGGPVGAAVGAGTGSFAVEAANSFLEGAAQAGVNLKDPEQVRAFFADESKIKEARAFAMERGFPVALFDALTAGMAGKFLKPALGKGLGRVAAASAGEAVMQMAGGAAGETAAQVVSGQELSAKDIAAEAIGELVTAPTEVASNLREEFQHRGAVKGGRFIDEAQAPAAALPKEPKEEPVSVDALADLQAAMRGNQLKPVPVAAQPTEEVRAALEFQRKTDEAVRAAVENPDKNYAGMERTELELLDAMGDAQAKVALRRMNQRRVQRQNDEMPQADQESFQPVINQDGLDRRALTKSARQTFALSKNESLADSTFILEDGTPINSDRPEWGGSTHAGVARFGYGNADNPFVPLKFMSDSGAVRVYFTDRGEVPRLYLEASAPLSLQQHITLGRLFGELKKQFASFDVAAEVSTLPPGPEWKKIPSGGEQYNWREKKVIRSAEFSSGQVTEVHRFFAVPASQPVDFVAAQPTGDAQAKAERKRRAKESEAKFLQSLKPPEPLAREAYAGTMEEEAPDSLLSVVNGTQRVAAPPLQSAIDAMRGGKSPREVVTEWGGGRGEHDALVDILEQINVARESKSLAQLGQLRKAYLKAFREGTRPNVDQALGDLVSDREQGFAPAGGVPEDEGTLYTRLFEDAGGARSAEPSAQELGLYFMDTITRDTGRGRQLDRELPVELNALSVGDTLRVKGVEMRVSAIDPDTDAVTFRASDPKEFGQTQTLTPEQAPVVYPDFGSYRKVRREVDWKLDDGERIEAERRQREETDAVESALDKLKIETPPGSLQAFGLLPETWNQLIEIVRKAYRAGKSIAAAIDDGIAWLRQNAQGFDEAKIRDGLESEVKGESLRAQIKALEKEMAVYVNRKEAIPADLLERYKDLADTLADEMRTGREKRGEFTGRVTSVVDTRLEPRSKQDKDTPKPKTRPSGYVPQWKGEERLPGGRLRDLFTGLTNWRQRTGNWLDRREARADITVGRDAGDNRANLAANMAAMNIRLTLNRALNTAPGEVRKKHAAREAALTFVIEADGNGQMLDEFYDRIASSEHAESKAGRQALAALEYASTHWDAMAAAAEQYKRLTTAQREMELNEGINSGEWEGGYIYHRWERDPGEAGADATKPSPSGTPFRKPRSVPNYAEGIAQGRVPLTLNSIELLAERVASGQRRLNELRWVHGLRSMLDPVSDLPVVTDVIRKPVKPVQTQQPRRADPDSTEQAFEEGYKPQYITTAPAGYQVWRLGDLEVSVQEGFVGLLGKLTSQSFFKGEKLKKVFGFVKSSLLMFDTFHLGRMAAWAGVITGNPFSYQRGQTLLDFTESDIREMAKRGEIPESWADGLVENKRRLNLALETGFNVGNVLDNAWGDALHNLPVVGTFNKWLFGQYQRGAMAQAWLIEFERMRKMMPKATELQVARRVSKDVNARFGNLNRQGIFKSRTAQDLVRFVFLAPQWNESLIRSELGAIAQTLKAPIESYQQRRLVAGTLMRATGVMALGTFLVNQVLNYAFRGKPTWENDEEGWDKKLSAWIPDVVSGGPGFFLNPLALPAEYTHLIEGNLHRSGGELMEAIRRVAVSRLHAAARPVEIFLTRKDALGRKLRDGEVLPAMAKAMTPVPIGAVAPATAAKQLFTGEPSEKYPGQYQRQMLSTFGMKVDQAPNAEQRIRTLARDFNKAKGIVPNAEYYAGDFSELDKALRLGNMANAREAMDELLQKKTARQIYEHYVRSVRAPFTGQQGREKEFWRGLTPEQRERYDEARESRKARAVKAAELLKERLKVAR